MVKKALCLLFAVVMIFPLCGCDDRAAKEDIFTYVKANQEILSTAIENGDVFPFEKQGVIKSVYYDSYCIDFYCGGVGMGSQTEYVGFFYSPSDSKLAKWLPSAYAFMFVPCGNGFECKETNGDNRFFVEKICDNFFYYEESY